MDCISFLFEIGFKRMGQFLVGFVVEIIVNDMQFRINFVELVVEIINFMQIFMGLRGVLSDNHIVDIFNIKSLFMEVLQEIAARVNSYAFTIPSNKKAA